METSKAKTSVEEQLQKLKQVFTKVEENYSKLEKSLKKKDESLQDANVSMKNYSKVNINKIVTKLCILILYIVANS